MEAGLPLELSRRSVPSLPLAMARHRLLAFFLVLSSLSSSIIASSPADLSVDFYKGKCDRFQGIMNEVVIPKQTTTPTTAAATLRVFFHDCMVGGCDASLLITSNAFHKSERDVDINHSLAGDAFDVVVRAKTSLELECPNTVSCADILAVATRNLVMQVGGPHYEVKLGRRDSLESRPDQVMANLATVNMSLDQIIPKFESKGFTLRDMVALTGGGHTIGFAHCKEFANRIFGPKPDPGLHPKLAERLRTMCANYTTDTTMAAFLDPITSGKFDNMFFQNLLRGLGVLATDRALVTEPRTKPIVEQYAKDSALFFKDFASAMEKLSVYGVKTGNEGEIRHKCDSFNTLPGQH